MSDATNFYSQGYYDISTTPFNINDTTAFDFNKTTPGITGSGYISKFSPIGNITVNQNVWVYGPAGYGTSTDGITGGHAISINEPVGTLTNLGFLVGGGGGGGGNGSGLLLGGYGGEGGGGGGGAYKSYSGGAGGYNTYTGTTGSGNAGGGGGGWYCPGGVNDSYAGGGGGGFYGGGGGAGSNEAGQKSNGISGPTGGNGGYYSGGGGAGGGEGGVGGAGGGGGGGCGGGFGGGGTYNGGNGGFGIYNLGTILFLNNAQGCYGSFNNSTQDSTSPKFGPLYLGGIPPSYYNMIITSPKNYGQLFIGPCSAIDQNNSSYSIDFNISAYSVLSEIQSIYSKQTLLTNVLVGLNKFGIDNAGGFYLPNLSGTQIISGVEIGWLLSINDANNGYNLQITSFSNWYLAEDGLEQITGVSVITSGGEFSVNGQLNVVSNSAVYGNSIVYGTSYTNGDVGVGGGCYFTSVNVSKNIGVTGEITVAGDIISQGGSITALSNILGSNLINFTLDPTSNCYWGVIGTLIFIIHNGVGSGTSPTTYSFPSNIVISSYIAFLASSSGDQTISSETTASTYVKIAGNSPWWCVIGTGTT